VFRVLGDEDHEMVSSAEIDHIREGLATGLLLRPHPCLAVGTKVRVRDGVFGGVEGIVSEFRHQCRVVIALGGVRQCFSLEVEFSDLIVLKEPEARPRLKLIPAYGD
jgi:hypothetical protein